jgi:hypothetical protein
MEGGTLTRDPRSGLGIETRSGEAVSVIWPVGFTAWEVGAEVVLRDEKSDDVARTGDAVTLAGANLGDGWFSVCLGVGIVTTVTD